MALFSAAAGDPKTARAGTGPTKAGELDPAREGARKRVSCRPGDGGTMGSRSEAEDKILKLEIPSSLSVSAKDSTRVYVCVRCPALLRKVFSCFMPGIIRETRDQYRNRRIH